MADHKELKQILIMGHPRSGTSFMPHLFRRLDLDVAHEVAMGKDGISSWLFCVDRPRWGPDPDLYEFRNRVHLVRHPVSVVSSTMISVESGVTEYMDKIAGIDPSRPMMDKAIRRYLHWHDRIVATKPNMTVKIEDAAGHFSAWRQMGPDAVADVHHTNQREYKMSVSPVFNGERPPNIPWKNFEQQMKHDLVTLGRFERLIWDYGYDSENGVKP